MPYPIPYMEAVTAKLGAADKGNSLVFCFWPFCNGTGRCRSTRRCGALFHDVLMLLMLTRVTEFVRRCLDCARADKVVPRQLGGVVNGKEIGEVMHFDHLHPGEGAVMNKTCSGGGGISYLLVMMEDVRNYVWLIRRRRGTRKHPCGDCCSSMMCWERPG